MRTYESPNESNKDGEGSKVQDIGGTAEFTWFV